jgi:hypothetical protein
MHPGENSARWLCLIIIVLIFTVGTLRGEEHPSESPTQVSVSDLGRDPQKFDGRLVRVQALLVFGWEGDNFLSDPDPRTSDPAGRHISGFKLNPRISSKFTDRLSQTSGDPFGAGSPEPTTENRSNKKSGAGLPT